MLRKLLIRATITVALAYIAYAALIFVKQRQMLFPIAADQRHAFRAPLPANASLVELPVSFGRARGVFLRGPDRVAPVILYTHGNAEIVDQNLTVFDRIQPLGVHVFLLELPGYAGADGDPGFDSIGEASTAAYDWLAAHALVDRGRIIAMGASIGGAPAAELSRRRPLRALVLQSTFGAVSDFAHGYYLPAWLVRDPFDTVARLAAFKGPVLITHGRNDDIIPFAHGERLASAAPQARFHIYDCAHIDCPYRDAEFSTLLGEFLREHALLDAQPDVMHAVQ